MRERKRKVHYPALPGSERWTLCLKRWSEPDFTTHRPDITCQQCQTKLARLFPPVVRQQYRQFVTL